MINLERGVNDDGLKGGGGTWGIETFLAFVDHVHARDRAVILMDYGDEPHEREYGLAGWFLVSAGRDFMCSNQLAWTAPGSRSCWITRSPGPNPRISSGPTRW